MQSWLFNSLWFLSLITSLTGALIAVFIQQWAHSYLRATGERHSPKDRARIRAFHWEGLENFYLHQVTRAVPILIHGSLFLFFSGLPIFLFNINRTVFNVVVTWLGLCLVGYACITLMPIFSQYSPYYSPLSSSIWWCFTNSPLIIYRLLKKSMSRDSSILQWYDAHYANSHLRWPSLRAMQEAAGRFALGLPSDIDYRALLWMFKTLSDDDEFEQFFDALPSLCDSEELEHPRSAFINPNEKILSRALIGMMDRTLLSDMVSEEVKQRRIIICTKVIGATSLLGPWWTLRRVLFGDWHGFSRSIHFGLFVQDWKHTSDPVTIFYAQYVVAITLASVQDSDDHWFELASGQLNESKSLLRNYHSTYGDSIQLANAIFIIRRTIQTSGSEKDHRSDILEVSSKTLELICRFDIQDTLAELQHQFCGLWNQLVGGAENTHPLHVRSPCVMTLKRIRRLYLTLHKNTSYFPTAFSTSTDDGDPVLDDPGSYPRCNSDEHRHFQPIPDLQLDDLPRNARLVNAPSSMDMMPALSSALDQVIPQTFSTPPHPLTPAAPNPQVRFAPNTSHRVFPSPYPVARGPHRPNPAPPGPSRFGPVPRVPHQLGPLTYALPARSFSDSPASFFRESAPPHAQEPPVNPAGADNPISTPAPATSAHNIDANRGNPGPAATLSRLGRPSILSTPRERVPIPKPPSLPQAPVSSPDTSTLHVPPDTSSAYSNVVKFANPRTPRALPEFPPGQTMRVSNARADSRPLPFPTPMTGGGSPTPLTGGGTISVPSSAVRRGGPTQTAPPLPSVIKVNGYGEFSGLLHNSPHSVSFEGELYPTALHLFEACKFLPHRPDLADCIRQCESVEEVISISAELADFIRRDWGKVMLSTVSKCSPSRATSAKRIFLD
jgi:hypothetical protein